MILDIIKKYEETVAAIDSLQSPKRKLLEIINFFRECERQKHFPPNPSFIEEFIPVIINIINSTSINFIDPVNLKSLRMILNISKKFYKDVIINNQIIKAVDIINMQMLKTYFYLGEYEEGLVVLKKMVEEQENEFRIKNEELRIEKKDKSQKAEGSGKKEDDRRKKDENKKIIGNKYSLVSKDIFKKSRAFEILQEIKYELDRLNSYSSDEINVLLVEDEGNEDTIFGVVQPLICNIIKKKLKEDENIFKFENISDLHDEKSYGSLINLENSFKKLLSEKNNIISKNVSIELNFENLANIYKGASFLFPASVLSFCKYLKFRNSIEQFSIHSACAFTSSLDENGNLIPLPYISLKAKIKAAFFSWINTIVISKSNEKDAKEIVDKLIQKYNNKKFKLICIGNVNEIFNYPEIIKTTRDSLFRHSVKTVRRHQVAYGITFSILMLIFGFYFATKFFPRDIKPLPRPEYPLNIIYTPDRDTNWLFNNENYFGGDTIDFGDVAVGDQWMPRLELWNNSQENEKIKLELKGKDKDEFDISWKYSKEQSLAPEFLLPDIGQSVYIKFTPFKNEGRKEAELVISTEGNNEQVKTIYLKGNAKRLAKGYSLSFANGDDEMVFEPGVNLLTKDFTICFWMKPFDLSATIILSDVNNPFINEKFYFGVNADYKFAVQIYGSKTREITNSTITSNNKVKLNEWNFFAVTFKDSIFSVILNDDFVSKNIGKNAIRQFNDCIYFNGNHPENIGKKTPDNQTNKFLLDEFRIYKKAFLPKDIVANRFDIEKLKRDDLAFYCNMDDAIHYRVFDNTSNDYWPKLYGGVNRSLDNAPVKVKEKSQYSPNKNIVFKRYNKGLNWLSKNLFTRKSSYTYQCDFRVIEKKIVFLGIWAGPIDICKQTQASIAIGDSIAFRIMDISGNGLYKYIKSQNNFSEWNRFTISYDSASNKITFFINANEVFSYRVGEKLMVERISPDIEKLKEDVTAFYMGTAFGSGRWWGDPRPFGSTTGCDNIKIYNRAISPDEIFGDSRNGLLAFWTFQKIDKELAYDEINNLPLLMWEDFELINEEIKYQK
jgi:hypothetical protein